MITFTKEQGVCSLMAADKKVEYSVLFEQLQKVNTKTYHVKNFNGISLQSPIDCGFNVKSFPMMFPFLSFYLNEHCPVLRVIHVDCARKKSSGHLTDVVVLDAGFLFLGGFFLS